VDIEGSEYYGPIGTKKFGMITEFEPDREVFPIKAVFLILNNTDTLIDLCLDFIAERLVIVNTLLCSPSIDSDSHTDEGIENTDR